MSKTSSQDNLEPAREEFCPASSATPAPSPAFSMDYDTMDYNRLLSHFDLEGTNGASNVQGKSGRKHRGRRNNRQLKVKRTRQANDNSQSNTSDTAKDFGRVLVAEDKPEFGSPMKRLRKRITG